MAGKISGSHSDEYEEAGCLLRAMEAVSSAVMLVISTRLHSATFQKTAIFKNEQITILLKNVRNLCFHTVLLLLVFM
jgi:hypothetical protein